MGNTSPLAGRPPQVGAALNLEPATDLRRRADLGRFGDQRGSHKTRHVTPYGPRDNGPLTSRSAAALVGERYDHAEYRNQPRSREQP